MNYMIALNTFAFIVLLVGISLYMDTHHKLHSCKFDINNVWCYNDLHCSYDTTEHDSAHS